MLPPETFRALQTSLKSCSGGLEAEGGVGWLGTLPLFRLAFFLSFFSSTASKWISLPSAVVSFLLNYIWRQKSFKLKILSHHSLFKTTQCFSKTFEIKVKFWAPTCLPHTVIWSASVFLTSHDSRACFHHRSLDVLCWLRCLFLIFFYCNSIVFPVLVASLDIQNHFFLADSVMLSFIFGGKTHYEDTDLPTHVLISTYRVTCLHS